MLQPGQPGLRHIWHAADPGPGPSRGSSRPNSWARGGRSDGTRSQDHDSDGRAEAAATDTAAAPLRQFAGGRPAPMMEMKAQPGTWTATRSRAGKVPSES